MSLLFAMAIRNLGRNWFRTLLTSLTVTLGVALLITALSFVGGVFWGILEKVSQQAGQVRVTTLAYAQRDQLMPLIENMPDTDPIVAALKATPGVIAAYPHLAMGVTGAVGDNEIGEQFGLLHGAPTEYYTEVLNLDEHIAEGRMPTSPEEALFGKQFAADLGAKLGDEIVLLGQTQDGSPSPLKLVAVGLVDLGSAQMNRQMWVDLEKARYMADIEAGSTEILVYGKDYEKADGLAATILERAEFKELSVLAWSQRPPYDGFVGFARALHTIAGGVIVFITGLGVLNTMFMSVLERTAEIGVMRALGLKKTQTVLLIFIEALTIGALGGLAGVLMGGPVAYFLEVRGINLGEAASKMPATLPVNEIMHPDVTPEILLFGFTLGLAMAVVGGLLPSLRAAGIEPVEAMRTRR